MRRVGLASVLLLCAAIPAASAAPPAATEPPSDPGPSQVLAILSAAWDARDIGVYMSMWSFASPAAEKEERAFIASRLGASGQSRLSLNAPTTVGPTVKRVTSYGEVVTIQEPWGQVDQIAMRLEKQNERWVVVSRQMLDHLEGLAHLSLEPNGFMAKGQVLRLPDFELTMTTGTLFVSPDKLGRTAWVFAGEGHVRFSPGPAAERDQLRRFCGRTELDEPVKLAFFRVNPGDVPAILTGPPLVPDPGASARWPTALHFYGEHAESSYLIDSTMPGAPWWLIPASGDGAVVFESARGPLTLNISRSSSEGVSFFDRPRQRQICLYPLPGRPRDFDDAGDRRFDVVHTDVHVTLDPDIDRISGEARLRLAMLASGSTIQLRLHEGLTVDSITSEDGRRYLSFRLRQQKSVVVAMRSLGVGHETTLTIRYHGTLRPPPFEREPSGHEEPVEFEKALRITPPTVYSQLAAWYPQAENDDFATATLQADVPAEYTIVGPGKRTVSPGAPGRSVYHFSVEKPIKQLVIAVARLVEGGQRRESGVNLMAYTVPHLKTEAVATLELATQIVRVYTEAFGPCPYADLGIVLIEAAKPGGHSPPGMVLLARRPLALGVVVSNDPANVSDQPGFFLAHEIAHQWWGDGVAPASYHDRWISEAAAHYAAALWVRQSRGEDAFRGVLREMGRWALEKNDAGPISLGHRVGLLESDPQLYRAVVYDKGACVLNMLRLLVGDADFQRGLTGFQEHRRFQKAGTPELRQALEEASHRDLSAYFEAWIYGTELPTLTLTARVQPLRSGNRTMVDIKAQNLPGQLPVNLTVDGEGGRDSRVVDVAADGGHWEIDTAFLPRRVRLNEDAGLLAHIND